MEKKDDKKKYKGIVKSTSSGKNKMATKFWGSTNWFKNKTQLEINTWNNLLFVSEEFISKK